MRFQVFLSLWSVTSCLCLDMIPEVAKTKVSKPKRYSLSKLRLCHAPLKRLIQTHPHMSTSRCGEIFITPPKCLRKERGCDFYSRCSAVAATGAMSWRRCESETTFFGLPKEDTIKNQWLSCIYNTVPEQYNANIRVCAAQFKEDYFLNLAGEQPSMQACTKAVSIKWGNSNFARTVWRF